MYNNDPFAGLLYEKVLVELRENLKTDYYEELITSTFLDNNYALLLSVSPKPGLDKEFALADKAKLKAYKEQLSENELNQLIHETKELIQYQESKAVRKILPKYLTFLYLISIKKHPIMLPNIKK
jgi:Zn-dependent M16 (insulinase) family peptidase